MGTWAKTLRRQKAADPVRFRGHRGGLIPMHRALTQFQLVPLDVVTSLLIFTFFSALWFMLLPLVCRFWGHIFAIGLSRLPLQAQLESATYHLPGVRLLVPCLRMEPVFPTMRIWIMSATGTMLLFLTTLYASKKWLPAMYLVRTMLLVHASALVYFALFPASFPHTPNSYLEGLVTASLGLISIIPLLLALTYYIFDFGLVKKTFLTGMVMLYLVVFVPFQVLLQALVLEKSLLFMPVLYIIFGLPVDILLVISFYSWGMTWSFRTAST